MRPSDRSLGCPGSLGDVTTEGLSRRHALTAGATVGLGLPLLAACAGSDPSATDSSSSAAPAPAGPLTTTAAIDVGGGAIFSDEKVVVTQPSQGDFKCFSAVCPHQGCLVASVSERLINCMCHGSKFSIEDGSVENGPATSGLSKVDITVDGDDISVV